MKIQIKKAWINVKCCECGKVIYPNDVYNLTPERIASIFVGWKFCEECFNKIFTEEVRKKAE